jgi:hypothetical protein
VAPADPVAGTLNGFPNRPGELFHDAVPTVENIRTPWKPNYGLAHILYFAGVERFAPDCAALQKRQTMSWLMGLHPDKLTDNKGTTLQKVLGIYLAYLVIVGVLLILTALAAVMAGGLVSALFGGSSLKHFASPWGIATAAFATLKPLAALLLWVTLLSGQWRWFRESRLNLKLAAMDSLADRKNFKKDRHHIREKQIADHWTKLLSMLRDQNVAAGVTMGFTIYVGLELGVFQRCQNISGQLIGIAGASLLCSILLQTLINRRVPPLEKIAKNATAPAHHGQSK